MDKESKYITHPDSVLVPEIFVYCSLTATGNVINAFILKYKFPGCWILVQNHFQFLPPLPLLWRADTVSLHTALFCRQREGRKIHFTSSKTKYLHFSRWNFKFKALTKPHPTLGQVWKHLAVKFPEMLLLAFFYRASAYTCCLGAEQAPSLLSCILAMG